MMTAVVMVMMMIMMMLLLMRKMDGRLWVIVNPYICTPYGVQRD